jgi:hypothetical protein
MPRRTLIITAIPLAILMLFGGIGVIASRSGDAQARGEGAGGLPFAIAEPVQAKWNATAAANATFTFTIVEPPPGVARGYDLTREKIRLDDTRDVRIGKSRSRAPDCGLLVNNGSKAEHVLIDGLDACDCTEYGGYIDGAKDWWIRNSVLHQAAGATQHGLRIASGKNIRISDTLIDSHLADKTTLWVLYGENIELRNVKLLGGRNWFSIDPENPDLGDGRVRNVIIADCWMDLDQDWSNAFEFMPGCNAVTITNLHVRSAKPPIGVWSSLGGVEAANNVRWKDIWIPAPGQAADTPFDELEWVKLRDDDWDRILTHKGSTREEVLERGIGPLDAPRP